MKKGQRSKQAGATVLPFAPKGAPPAAMHTPNIRRMTPPRISATSIWSGQRGELLDRNPGWIQMVETVDRMLRPAQFRYLDELIRAGLELNGKAGRGTLQETTRAWRWADQAIATVCFCKDHAGHPGETTVTDQQIVSCLEFELLEAGLIAEDDYGVRRVTTAGWMVWKIAQLLMARRPVGEVRALHPKTVGAAAAPQQDGAA